MQTDLGADSPSQGPIPDTGEGSTFTKGSLWSAFRQRRWGGQRPLPMSIDSQLSSNQNNAYAKGVYFTMSYPDPLQYQNKIISNQKEGNRVRQKLHQNLNAN